MNIKIFKETLDELQDRLCNILGVEKLEIIRKEIKEDAILDFTNNQIIISNKFIDDIVESKKALIHEMRHQYQLYCIALDIKEERMRKMWAFELKYDEPIFKSEYRNLLFIEIDAYAFTKIYMKKEYDFNVKYSNKYEKIIKDYLKNDLKY